VRTRSGVTRIKKTPVDAAVNTAEELSVLDQQKAVLEKKIEDLDKRKGNIIKMLAQIEFERVDLVNKPSGGL
jgi:hypothetical protein